MKLEEFIKSSAFLEIQISRTFFSPAIPKEKLSNAIKTYARHIKPHQALILIDEGGFFSEGEEGMIITNDEIILSPNFGYKTFAFDDIQSISIKNKALIINNDVICVFNKPEVMPLGYLGSKLSEYVELKSQEQTEPTESETVIIGKPLEKLKLLLQDLNQPTPFRTLPKSEQERLSSQCKNYCLTEDLTNEQIAFIKFKFKLATNEEILCVSWLDLHDSKDDLFCITNDAIYSSNGITKENVKIEFNELKDLDVCYSYLERIFNAIEFSNKKTICVSRSNIYMKPFTYELLSELICFLNK